MTSDELREKAENVLRYLGKAGISLSDAGQAQGLVEAANELRDALDGERAMICYKDMTFCPFYENCAKADTCDRPLTPKVKADARAWWGDNGGAPVMQYTVKPRCHVERK